VGTKIGDRVMFANEIEGIVVRRIDNNIVVLVPQEKTCYFTTRFNLVWLPTQRQLQEMLFPNNYFWHYMKTLCLECFADLVGYVDLIRWGNLDAGVVMRKLWKEKELTNG